LSIADLLRKVQPFRYVRRQFYGDTTSDAVPSAIPNGVPDAIPSAEPNAVADCSFDRCTDRGIDRCTDRGPDPSPAVNTHTDDNLGPVEDSHEVSNEDTHEHDE
jgi:hypothetical protein